MVTRWNWGPLWNTCHMVTLLGTHWYRGCWPSTFIKLHRHTALDTKYSSWKYSGVRTRNPQQVDEIVFPQSKQENVVLEETCLSRSQFVQKVGAYGEQGREGKEKQQGKVSPWVVVSNWKSPSGCHVPSTMSSSSALCMLGHYCRMPCKHRQC